MYAKLFASIYQGTLRGDSRGLLVFTNLLAHADQAGIADIHPRAIAEEVGLPIEEVRSALLVLEAPDDESRSPEEGGRRLLRMDEHRAWGWKIVNYGKYRSIRSEDDRREQNRIAQAKWREANSRKQSKPASATGETDKPIQKEKEKEINTSLLSQAPARQGRPVIACPHAEILKAWEETLPAMPQHNPKMWNGSRADHLRARWRETAAHEGWTSEEQGLAYFRNLFAYAGRSQFLTGRTKQNGHRPFHIELEWLVNPSNWAKVHEGKYHVEDAA